MSSSLPVFTNAKFLKERAMSLSQTMEEGTASPGKQQLDGLETLMQRRLRFLCSVCSGLFTKLES